MNEWEIESEHAVVNNDEVFSIDNISIPTVDR